MPTSPDALRVPFRPWRRRIARGVSSVLLPAVLLVPVAPAASGCSFLVSPDQQVTIQASDPAAEIFVNGRAVGTGTATVRLRRNHSHGIQARLPDGRVSGRYLNRTISTTGILDIVGGIVFLFPFLGLIAPGAWQLEPDFVQLDLPQAPPPTLAPAPANSVE